MITPASLATSSHRLLSRKRKGYTFLFRIDFVTAGPQPSPLSSGSEFNRPYLSRPVSGCEDVSEPSGDGAAVDNDGRHDRKSAFSIVSGRALHDELGTGRRAIR